MIKEDKGKKTITNRQTQATDSEDSQTRNSLAVIVGLEEVGEMGHMRSRCGGGVVQRVHRQVGAHRGRVSDGETDGILVVTPDRCHLKARRFRAKHT